MCLSGDFVLYSVSLFTDGERRYGNRLFEICHELGHNGKPGRPKKTFKKGVHVRVTHKGKRSRGKLIENQWVNFLGFAHRLC